MPTDRTPAYVLVIALPMLGYALGLAWVALPLGLFLEYAVGWSWAAGQVFAWAPVVGAVVFPLWFLWIARGGDPPPRRPR